MLGTGQNPSTPIVSKGLRAMRPFLLAVLGSLMLAGGARGAAPIAEEAPKPAPTEPVTAEGAPAPPTEEAAPAPTPVEPVTEETPAPAPTPVEPVAEETPAPAPTPVEPVAEETPAPAPAEPVAGEKPAEPVAKPASEGSPPSAAAQGPTPPDQGGPALPGEPVGSLTITVGIPAETQATAAPPTEVVMPTAIRAARKAGSLGCVVAALAGPMTGDCAAGGSATQRALAGSPVGFAAAAVAAGSLTGTGPGAPPGSGDGDSSIGSPPFSPAPGSAPSGASGAAAAGGSGLGLSAFLTLAGLLGLAAPRAMRRLRLFCQPWRTACFVLIPERPD